MLGGLTELLARSDRIKSTAEEATPTKPADIQLRVTKGSQDQNPVFAALIVAAGNRLSGRYNDAAKVLDRVSVDSSEWQTTRDNERASLLWESGRREEAIEVWEQLQEGAVRSFNLGIAKLILGRPEQATHYLNAACKLLPESSGWCHLARLYLAIAEDR
jgi:hypothetical protein